MISDLHEVIRWAKENECYTDEKCGLHMNVSIQDIDMSSVDFIKLALFLGDDYVLEHGTLNLIIERSISTYYDLNNN